MSERATIQFKDFVTLQRGFDLPTKRRNPGPFPVVASTSIQGCHDKFRVEPPGVVTGRSGSLGKVIFLDQPFWPLNTTLWVKDFKGNNPRYVYYFLQTLDLEQFNSGAGVPTLNRNHLSSLEIEVDDLETQREIAGILSAYDDLIENNTRRIQILEEMARAIYREWFVHFRYPGHENDRLVDSGLGPIPEGWEVVPFTEVADILSGGTPKTKVPEYWGGDTPFFTPRDAPNSYYVFETEKSITDAGLNSCSSSLFPAETVFITARGTVGKLALNAVPMAMNQSCYALRGRAGISQHFLYLATLSEVDYLKKNTGGATFDTIIVDTFRRMRVVRPPQELISEFSEIVGSIFEQSRVLQQQSLVLTETRDLVLPRLILGML